MQKSVDVLPPPEGMEVFHISHEFPEFISATWFWPSP